jgi:intracellular multiplication protein IcmP
MFSVLGRRAENMAAPQQGGNSSDNSAAMLWWVAALFAAIGAIWYVFKNHIIGGYLAIKLYELDLISYFATFLNRFMNIDVSQFAQVRSVLMYARMNPANVSYPDLVSLGTVVGDWLRFPLMLLMLGLAVVVYFGNTVRVFKRNYNMQDLAKLEKNNWPQITPVVGLDLLKTDIDTGPWAMAMTPMQFCKRYSLLEEVKPQRREGMSRQDWDRIDVVLKRGEANKVFALQLGQLWKDVNALPPHTKALFAVFAARINADTKEAAKIVSQLNFSSSGTLDMSGVDELIKKHAETKLVQKVVQSHAYVLTVMAGMLAGAREDGVQATADFLWLKPRDRRLWYTLNTVGRQTPFIEVAGVFAHWAAEKEAGRRIMVPMVEEATHAVEIALKEVVYRPDQQQ